MVLPNSSYFDSNNLVCEISGFLSNYGRFSGLLWINIFNYYLYLVIVKEDDII